MSESDFQKNIRLIEKYNELVLLGKNKIETVLAKNETPEIVSEKLEKQRMDGFLQALYIDSHSLNFSTLKVKFGNFIAISRENKNMSIAVRLTKIVSIDGSNLIDPDTVPDRDDMGAYYINHSNGFAGFMSCMDPPSLNLIEGGLMADIDHVEGEVYVGYTPGYDVCRVNASQVGELIKYLDVEFCIPEFGKRYVILSMTPEHLMGYKVEAYNKNSERLECEHWARHPIFNDEKTALDFTEASLPDKSEIIKYAYCFLFNGDVDYVDVYLPKHEKSGWHPIKTTRCLPYSPDWDYFKKATEGPIDVIEPGFEFQPYTEDELNSLIHCDFKYEEGNSLNQLILDVVFPRAINSNFTKSQFVELTISKDKKSPEIPLSFEYNYTRTGICNLQGHRNEVGERENIEIIPDSSIIRGKIVVDYPAVFEWVEIGKSNPLAIDGHSVEFDGGLVSYKKPEGYTLQKLSSEILHQFILPYNKNGELLKIEKFDTFYDGDKINFGVWGTVEYVKIAIIRKTLNIQKEFEFVVRDT